MSQQHIQYELSSALSELIVFDAHGRAVWPTDDLKSGLRQQLAATLVSALPHRELVLRLASSALPPIVTFRDLLHHPRPQVELLCIAKDFAKLARADFTSPLPPDVPLVLYYGCIAAGMLHLGQCISRLSEDDLRAGFNWCVQQVWLDEQTHGLFLDALRHLRTPRGKWRIA